MASARFLLRLLFLVSVKQLGLLPFPTAAAPLGTPGARRAMEVGWQRIMAFLPRHGVPARHFKLGGDNRN